MRKGICLFLLMVCSGCDLIDNSELISSFDLAPSLAGEWRLQGGATLEWCTAKPEFNGDFSFSSEPMMVIEETGEDGEVALVLEEPIEGFELLDVKQNGSTLRFKTLEETAAGDVELTFSGSTEDFGVIEGSVDGTAPGGCAISGTFTLTIENDS